MRLFLVHHGDAVESGVDPRRPLSPLGAEAVDRLAAAAHARGARPAVVWHSGKMRARQTATAFFRTCNPFAELSATKDLQPGDKPEWMRDRLLGESRDILIAGHFPHLWRLLGLLLRRADLGPADFPVHGAVALDSDDAGETWKEAWRLEQDGGDGRAVR